jgi:hypothetical protein
MGRAQALEEGERLSQEQGGGGDGVGGGGDVRMEEPLEARGKGNEWVAQDGREDSPGETMELEGQGGGDQR